MKKAKIALASIALLGIAGSIVAFKSARNKTRSAYYTFQYNAAAVQTFTKASALIASPSVAGTVYYTLTKNDAATIYARLLSNS